MTDQSTSSTGCEQSELSILLLQPVGCRDGQPDTSGTEGMTDWQRPTPRIELLHLWRTKLVDTNMNTHIKIGIYSSEDKDEISVGPYMADNNTQNWKSFLIN